MWSEGGKGVRSKCPNSLGNMGYRGVRSVNWVNPGIYRHTLTTYFSIFLLFYTTSPKILFFPKNSIFPNLASPTIHPKIHIKISKKISGKITFYLTPPFLFGILFLGHWGSAYAQSEGLLVKGGNIGK